MAKWIYLELAICLESNMHELKDPHFFIAGDSNIV